MPPLSAAERKEVEEAFDLFDADRTGSSLAANSIQFNSICIASLLSFLPSRCTLGRMFFFILLLFFLIASRTHVDVVDIASMEMHFFCFAL